MARRRKLGHHFQKEMAIFRHLCFLDFSKNSKRHQNWPKSNQTSTRGRKTTSPPRKQPVNKKMHLLVMVIKDAKQSAKKIKTV